MSIVVMAGAAFSTWAAASLLYIATGCKRGTYAAFIVAGVIGLLAGLTL